MEIELLIQNGNTVYAPVTQDEIVWTTERKSSPGKLEFKVLKDNIINYEEGNPISFKVNGNKVFYGFVFTKKREKDKIIKTTAYDQLRYLKNKSSYVYVDKRADELVRMIANDFQLNVGTLENTNYKIAKKSESNQALFDIILNALDETIQYKKEMYVLYDDFGQICLKNLERMKVGLIIDEETAQNFDYQSSIDTDTYNKVKLVYDNEKTGKREVYIAQDTSNMNKWGVLQYFDTIDEKTNGAVKAKTLLNLYNQKTRNLEIKNVIGDIRVRGGSLIIVNLDLGDVKLQNFMLVEKAKHTFKNGEHFMDLTLRGQDFISQ
ncbi:MAG TPA: hydrolase [Clostridiales bacterium]|nr:hydrolase [Clostridiales bacterium]